MLRTAVHLTLALVVAMIGAALLHLLGADVAAGGFLLAQTIVAPPKDLKTILKDLKKIQDDHTGKAMPEDVAEQFDKLAEEAKVLQDENDRKGRIRAIEESSRRVEAVNLPGAKEQGRPDDIVGYLTLGAAFLRSPEYKGFAAQGFPAAREIVAPFAGSFHRKGVRTGLIPITRAQLESKAVPTLSDPAVIRPDRLAEVVRAEEQQMPSIRDVLNVSQTDSNSIEYITRNFTRAAGPVADDLTSPATPKPEATMALGVANAPVRTIAVTLPVTEQQLQDVPNLQNMIDVDLTWDLKLTEEEQIVWGDGLSNNLLGIMNTPGVTAGRTVAGDTLVDQIRRAITDVQLARVMANAIVIHPLDWETVLLTKGSDSHYVWVIITDDNGHRLWALRVIETEAMLNAADGTQRRVLVGDFIRGATLWDRQQAGIQIGWVNDQFIRNQRTIRAEERLAFGVKRPPAFKYIETVAATP